MVLVSIAPSWAEDNYNVNEGVPDGIIPGDERQAPEKGNVFPPPRPSPPSEQVILEPDSEEYKAATMKESDEAEKEARAQQLKEQKEAAVGVLEGQRTLVIILAVILFLSLVGNLALYLYMRRALENRTVAVSAAFHLKAASEFARKLQQQLEGGGKHSDSVIEITDI